MNAHQKIALGGAVSMLIAWSMASLLGTSALGIAAIFTSVVFILTLPVTWRVLMTILEVVMLIISELLHGAGSLADIVIAGLNRLKVRSTRPVKQDPDGSNVGVDIFTTPAS